MKIVNPLYDKTFKYLMENSRLAKKILGVILETEVEELILSQQETVVPDEKRFFTLFRLDFKAIIRKADGSRETVLIELQKSKYDTDIQRFRNYLGANYINKITHHSIIGQEQEENETTSQPENYPIVTIYILGYKLPDLPYMAVKVNNQVIDSASGEPLDIDSFFVNMLTHRAHILQVRRLPKERKTRLEQFMLLFNQAWHADKMYILDLEEIPEEFKDIAEYLQRPVLDTEFRRQLEVEDEIDTIFDRQEAKYLKKIAEAEAQAEEALKEKADAQRREVEAMRKLHKAVKRMHNRGFTQSEIAEDLEITLDEVRIILET